MDLMGEGSIETFFLWRILFYFFHLIETHLPESATVICHVFSRRWKTEVPGSWLFYPFIVRVSVFLWRWEWDMLDISELKREVIKSALLGTVVRTFLFTISVKKFKLNLIYLARHFSKRKSAFYSHQWQP